jgi:hypothetical protein
MIRKIVGSGAHRRIYLGASRRQARIQPNRPALGTHGVVKSGLLTMHAKDARIIFDRRGGKPLPQPVVVGKPTNNARLSGTKRLLRLSGIGRLRGGETLSASRFASAQRALAFSR